MCFPNRFLISATEKYSAVLLLREHRSRLEITCLGNVHQLFGEQLLIGIELSRNELEPAFQRVHRRRKNQRSSAFFQRSLEGHSARQNKFHEHTLLALSARKSEYEVAPSESDAEAPLSINSQRTVSQNSTPAFILEKVARKQKNSELFSILIKKPIRCETRCFFETRCCANLQCFQLHPIY